MSNSNLGEILIVEDNQADLKLMSEILTQAGYTVRAASDGTLALRTLKAKLPDLILLDINLPDMYGVDVCIQLKTNPASKSIPVIFISAQDERELKVQALEAGGTDYVTKPVEISEFLARIKTHLKMHRLQQELLIQSAELKMEIEERQQTEILKTRFSRIIEETVNEIYVFDGNTFQFVHCNQTGRDNLGYTYEEMNELTIFDIKQDLSLEEFDNIVQHLRSGAKETVVFMATHFRKNGTTYPVEIHLQLMPEKSPLFVAIILDISERIRNDTVLRASEERFRTAFEAADDCILIWDRDYNYLYANRAAIDHVGSTADQVIGKNIRDGLGHIPDFMHLWMSRIDKVFESGNSLRVQDETVMNGRHFFTDSILSPLQGADGEVTSVYVVYRDITDLKKAEHALRDSLDIINRSPAVAFLWRNDENWPVEYVSENVKKILGYTEDDFLSGRVAYSNLIHPDDLSRVVEEVIRYSGDNKCTGFTHEPYRLLTQSGEFLWFDDRTTFQRDSSGGITHYQGIVLDITSKIEAGETQKIMENNLYQSDKMAAIGQLAAGVAHEVNNPVGFISSNLKTMSEYVQELKQYISTVESDESSRQVEELLEDFQEAVAESIEGANRVKKIVADMMGISRASSDKVENFHIHEGIESTLNIVWNQIKYNCIVEKEFGDIPQIQCIKNRINQVFLNLLVNAGHATQKKSGVIRIKTWSDEQQVHVSIKDNGTGIPKENLPKLFDAFYTTKEVGQGTGLGLSLSRDIIEQHAGTISVTSKVGEGTEFIVSLPIVAVGVLEEVPVT